MRNDTNVINISVLWIGVDVCDILLGIYIEQEMAQPNHDTVTDWDGCYIDRFVVV